MVLNDDLEWLSEYGHAFWLALIRAMHIEAILAVMTRAVEWGNGRYMDMEDAHPRLSCLVTIAMLALLVVAFIVISFNLPMY